MIATLTDLDEAALVTILTEPKNALVKQYQRLFEIEGVKLTFTADALIAIAKRAIKRKTGARGLRSIMEDILLDTMFELPGMDGVEEVVVKDEAVTFRRQADAGLHRDQEERAGEGLMLGRTADAKGGPCARPFRLRQWRRIAAADVLRP